MMTTTITIQSKYNLGDKIRIVKYGHLHYISKTGWKETSQFYAKLGHEMEHMLMWGTKPSEEELSKIEGSDLPANIISENETMWICDLHPELVGQEGIVAGSYAFLYGDTKSEITEKDYKSYSVKGIPGKCAWYNEEQLELIT